MNQAEATTNRQPATGPQRVAAPQRVACLGASATVALGSYDWIKDVAQRPGNEHWRFERFAEGGDMAANGLRRVPAILSYQPDAVIILLGDNDVMACISDKHYNFMRFWKRLPERPNPAAYHATMLALVRALKRGTAARLALASLIPLGEDPTPSNAFQAAANARMAEFSGLLRDIAAAEGIAYLPLYERIQALIVAAPGRAFTSFNFLPFYRDVFRQFVLGMDNDQIGRLNGWQFHRDGLHLNSRSGRIMADLAQEFLNA
jgi:lysophospholipase L1-like esterase